MRAGANIEFNLKTSKNTPAEHAYTIISKEQESSLIGLCVWVQQLSNPCMTLTGY